MTIDPRPKIAADWWAGLLNQPDLICQRFAGVLAKRISSVLAALPADADFRLGTDYDPDDFLWDVLAESGVVMPKFACDSCRDIGMPYKTRMNIEPTVIQTRLGRTGAWTDLWMAPKPEPA